jgi:hypothetical protein
MKEDIRLEDGRKGERHIIDEAGDDGSVKRTIELFVEPKIEKKLSKRVVEYTRPTIFKREIESIDEATGQVDHKIESVDPNVKMELRQHIVDTPVEALGVKEEPVTRAELRELLLAMNSKPTVSAFSAPVNFDPVAYSLPEASTMPPAQQIVKARQEGLGLLTSNNTVKYSVLGVVIVGQLVGLYFLFF